MVRPDKELVKKRFTRSLDTYDENALVQRETATRLIFELRQAVGSQFSRILEIGCGSGLLTKLVADQLKYQTLYLNDLAEACSNATEIAPNSEFISGDIESIDPLPDNLDLIISNATFQWLDTLSTFLPRLKKHLAPGGTLAFSTFGPDNAREIAELQGDFMHYHSPAELKQLVAAHFRICCFHENIMQLNFSHPLEVLKHLRNTGVTAGSGRIRTKSGLKKFIAEYIASCGGGAVTLTYHPIIIIAMNKS